MPPLSDLNLDELVRRALVEEEEDAAGEDTLWEAINELRHRGSRDVFERARSLVSSAVALERKLGIDVLGQLGLERPFREETVAILQGVMAAETDAEVQAAALVAFGHLRDERGRPHLLSLATNTAPEIRRSIAWALPSCAFRDEDGRLTDEAALRVLMVLMEDDDEDVRDWATFAVGQFFEDDTPEVRVALTKRLTDPHEDTREGYLRPRTPPRRARDRPTYQTAQRAPWVRSARRRGSDGGSSTDRGAGGRTPEWPRSNCQHRGRARQLPAAGNDAVAGGRSQPFRGGLPGTPHRKVP